MPKKPQIREERIQRDFILEMQEAGKITSVEMQFFVERMGSQLLFNVPDLAGVLGTSVNSIYALCEEGKIGYINRGSKKKHYYVFPRPAVLRFLQLNCNSIDNP